MSPLLELARFGQSYWLDDLSRPMIESGELQRRVTSEGLTGVTANPAIFRAALHASDAYDRHIRELAVHPLNGIYEALIVADVRDACDILRPVYDRTQGRDGFVSLEVSPYLAHNTEGSIAEAHRLWNAVARPNLFIKIPGTLEGLGAIEELTFQGIPINVTLLFSSEQYVAAARAYQNGLQRRITAGLDLHVPSVASLFVSRWDRATASQLPEHLRDELGIAVAKQTYRSYRELLRSEPWKALEARGAPAQRLLFASTGTKESAKPVTYYVEALAAPDTIDTIPPATLDAFVQSGTVGAHLSPDGGNADETIARIAAAGIDIPALAGSLQTAGAAAFVESWDHLLQSVESKVAAQAGPAR
jgi:transaldolase